MSVIGMLGLNPILPVLTGLVALSGRKAENDSNHNIDIKAKEKSKNDKNSEHENKKSEKTHNEHDENKKIEKKSSNNLKPPKDNVSNQIEKKEKQAISKVKASKNDDRGEIPLRKSKNHKISENESDNMSEKKEKQFNSNIKTSKSHSTKHQYNSKPIHKNKKCLVHDIDCSCECEKELCNMDLCLLGKKLIFSGAMLQENLGVFLVAESEKIEIAVDKFKKNHCASVTAEDLIKLNESVKDTICCLAKTEEEITQKIKMGEKFLHEKDPCPPHCHRHDEDNDDDDDD